jgi:GNAT superfamily N-acetyltransferase
MIANDHAAYLFQARALSFRVARRTLPRNDGRRTKTFQMPKAITEIRSLARSHTRKAINVLVGVMRSTNATPAARVAAANAILDRGWGKATQPLEGSNDGALELIHRIERVIGQDDEIAQMLSDLHRLTFFDCAPIPAFDCGHWWLTYHETNPIAFAGIIPSTRVRNAGYFSRVGVLKKHRGYGLQLRLMRTLEKCARHNGWNCVVSDTTENIASANNFICAGYRLYQPRMPWAWPNTLYWRKYLS